MRIGLVGCVKSKQSTARPAKDLYTSALFRGRRAWVEKSCERWFVLSAEHGLLGPDEIIAPYDVSLKAAHPSQRRTWAKKVLADLEQTLGPLAPHTFEIHAGSAYRDHGLIEGLREKGATVEIPAVGLRQGEQLRFYAGHMNKQAGRADAPARTTYAGLAVYLESVVSETSTLSFNEIASLCGRPLPASASRYRTWWANSLRSPQAKGWLAVGWKVLRVDLAGREITFSRTRQAPEGHKESSPAPAPSRQVLPFGPELEEIETLEQFSYRWPDASEVYERGWQGLLSLGSRTLLFRHGLGSRPSYGMDRARSVTWLNGGPVVEGVAGDDYRQSRSLLSVIKDGNGRHLRALDELPDDYRDFEVVVQKDELTAPHSFASLAVKIKEDDLDSWARHALIRLLMKQGVTRSAGKAVAEPAAPPIETPPGPCVCQDPEKVAQELLKFGARLEHEAEGRPRLTSNDKANEFVINDSFAFLIGVIADQGIVFERAWNLPYLLRERLGHLDPLRLQVDVEPIREAFQKRPALHRMVEIVPRWVCGAAKIVIGLYGGDASRIWSDRPTAVEVQRRLDEFPGIGQKKAAMAVEILARDLKVPIQDLAGSDVAFDIHLRRVFLRTGVAQHDDQRHMIMVARKLHPERPGALDNPAWAVGRRWCHPQDPDCPECALTMVCPKCVAAADLIRGV